MSHNNIHYEYSKAQLRFHRQSYSATHFHSNVEMKLVFSGEIEASLNGARYILSPGMGFIVFPYQRHSYLAAEDSSVCLVQLPYNSISAYSDVFGNKRPVSPVFAMNECGDLSGILSAVRGYFAKAPASPLKSGALAGFASALFGMVMSKIELCDKPSSGNEYIVEKIIEYCSDRFAGRVTLDDAARELFISKRQISRIFSEHLGTSFHVFINSLRVGLATEMLLSTTASVSDIAYECGFESLCTFNRVFRGVTGKTPSYIRRTGKYVDALT